MSSVDRRSRHAKPAPGTKPSAHPKRSRAKGLRPIRIWVPDVRSSKFAAEASRQARLIAESPYAAEDQAFLDALASSNDE